MYHTKIGEICFGRYPIKLYTIKDIERIEQTELYKELREEADKRRKKFLEKKQLEEEQRKRREAEEKRKLLELSKWYEKEDSVNSVKTFEKVKWQENCLKLLTNQRNVILASPTNSGKTIVFLTWALRHKERPIFITAPTKSLSNQRYKELKESKELNCVVGIETGDIKKVPNNSEIICCTQEIYTNKYANKENATLIIDEFHYIFDNEERTRAYIDGLINSKAKNILICSATLGDLEKVKKYINKITDRNFYLYKNNESLTKLVYKNEISMNRIKDSLVVAFSERNCNIIADKLCSIRKEIEEYSLKYSNKNKANFIQIEKLEKEYNIEALKFNDFFRYGVAVYYGKLLPKEKFFIEKAFEKRLLDVVVGTDALAFGVNFPIKNVIFSQLIKVEGEDISKNLFQQISGRAGRKGYFDEGYVYYCPDFYIDKFFYTDDYFYEKCLKDSYEKLLIKENEDIHIILTPIISKILKGVTTVEEEAEYIVNYSTEDMDIQQIINYINEEIEFINTFNINNSPANMPLGVKNKKEFIKQKQEEFIKNIANVYFDEYSPEENCYLFASILKGETMQQIITEYDFYDLLKFRRYVKRLPINYKKLFNIKILDNIINEIDDTALTI